MAVAAATVAVVLGAVGSSSSDAAQLRGAVVNDAWQLQTVGTAVAVGTEELPQPYTGNTLLIFSGQAADLPEVVPSFTAELAALKAAGAQVIRFTIPWTSLETGIMTPGSPPSFNPLSVARMNAIFAAIHASGLKAIVNISNTPCGRSSATNKNCDQLGAWFSYPPTDENDLTNMVKQVISLWGADIYALEVWNEPNNQGFFLSDQSQCDPSNPSALYGATPDANRAAAYVPMVKAAWQGVKSSSHPNILVLAGDTSLSDTQFLQDAYADGMQGYYDGISVHPYQLQLVFQPTPTSCSDRGGRSTLVASTQDPATPFSNSLYSFTTGVEAVHSTMQAHGDNTPIYITEFGFDSCSAAPNSTTKSLTGQAGNGADWSGACATPGWQGTWLAESYKLAAQWPYVAAITAYQTRDGVTGESQFSTDNWGLLHHDMTPKLAYVDVEQAWSCLAAGTC